MEELCSHSYNFFMVFDIILDTYDYRKKPRCPVDRDYIF